MLNSILVEQFAGIHRQKKSGVLTVVRPGFRLRFCIEDGDPVGLDFCTDKDLVLAQGRSSRRRYSAIAALGTQALFGSYPVPAVAAFSALSQGHHLTAGKMAYRPRARHRTHDRVKTARAALLAAGSGAKGRHRCTYARVPLAVGRAARKFFCAGTAHASARKHQTA